MGGEPGTDRGGPETERDKNRSGEDLRWRESITDQVRT